jgi:predicted Rossmann-fold nucleotide-binding protein
MALRPEVLRDLHVYAANGGITIEPLAGRSAGKQLRDLSPQVHAARRNLLLSELPSAYRINVFGSAKPTPEDEEYIFIRDTSRSLVRATSADLITGGGPGLMEAALEGAALGEQDLIAEGKSSSVRRFGVGIILPFEQSLNPHVTHPTLHEEFLPRLQEFVDMSHGSFVAPGGLGTDLELSVLLQLQQVGHLEPTYPIVVHPFWEDALAVKKKTMYEDRIKQNKRPYINIDDLDKIKITDDEAEIVDIFTANKDDWIQTIGRKPIHIISIDGAASLPPRHIIYGT